MTAVVIKLDGSAITDDVLFSRSSFTGVADGNIGSAVVVLKNDRGQYEASDLVTGMTLELIIDGERAWDGWIFATRRTWAFDVVDTTVPAEVPKFWTIQGIDRNLLFQKRILFRQDEPADDSGLKVWPAGTSDRTAILYALDNYVDLSGMGLSVGPGIKQIASPAPDGEFTLGYVSAPLGVLFNDAAKMTGGVFFVSPDRVVRYVSDLVVTAPFKLSDTPTGSQVGYSDMDAALDATEMANEALVWGAGRGSSEPVFARYRSSSSVAEHGLWQWGDIFIGAYKPQTVLRRAETYVEGSPTHRRGHGEDVPVVTCTIYEPGIRVGHVVDFINDVFDYQEPLPVRQSKMTFPTPDSVKYELELTLKVDTPFGAPDLWPIDSDDGPGDTDDEPPDNQPGDPDDPEAVGGLVLIDHFDKFGTFYWTVAEAIRTAATSHELLLPDDIDHGIAVGDLIVLSFVVDPPGGADVFTIVPGDYAGEFSFLNALTSSDRSGGIFAWKVNGLEGFDADGAITITATDDVGETNPKSFRIGYEVFVIRGHNIGASSSVPEDILNADPTSPLAFPSFNMTSTQQHASGATYKPYLFHFFGARYGSGATIFDRVVTYSGGGGGGVAQPEWIIDERNSIATSSDPAFVSGSLIVEEPDDVLDAFSLEFEDNYPVSGYGLTMGFVLWLYPAGDWEPYLPGPERTGSQYLGGNPYDLTYGPVNVANSRFIVDGTYSGFFVRDYYRSIVDPTQGDIVDPEPDIYPLTGFSQPAQLLFKIDFTGEAATRDGYIFIVLGQSFLTPGEGTADKVVPAFGLYWWRENPPVNSTSVEVYDHRFDPDAYLFEDGPTPLEPGTEYYLLIDKLERGGYARMKYWVVGETEPEDWAISTPLKVEKDDGDPTYEANELAVFLSAESGASTYLDAVWARVPVSLVPNEVSEVPVYASVQDEAAGLYRTSYPYVAGTLVIYYQGQLLVEGVDYFETSPLDGEFRLVSPQDLSANLTVFYTRASPTFTVSPSGYYRPAPVLQGGWGTKFDGFNCTMASSVMALDRHTLGAYTPFKGSPRSTPPSHRAFQYDQVGGTGIDDAAVAWANGWGQTLGVGIYTWAAFMATLGQGRGAIIGGVYGLLPASKRFSSTYTGGHSIYINEILPNGNLWGIDPLFHHPVIYTPGELQPYAEALPWVPNGHIWAGFTRIT